MQRGGTNGRRSTPAPGPARGTTPAAPPAAAEESQTPVHPRAAQALRAGIPEVVEVYRASLLRMGSPLATRPEAWPQSHRQALAILGECADALGCGVAPPVTETDDYTRLLGAHRALQRIPAAESVRAVEVLWSALEPAVHRAAALEPPADECTVWKSVNTAFRAAAGARLLAGLLGYEEALGRTLAARPDPPEPGFFASVPELTARERQVLDAVAGAMTNRQIARQLGITEATVKRHLSNIFGKLGASSRMDAVRKAAGRRTAAPPDH